jgi:hypothetical protein
LKFTSSTESPILPVVTRPKDKKPGTTKRLKAFRLTPDTVRKLQAGAEEYGMSETAYTELALKNQFKKDGIK